MKYFKNYRQIFGNFFIKRKFVLFYVDAICYAKINIRKRYKTKNGSFFPHILKCSFTQFHYDIFSITGEKR